MGDGVTAFPLSTVSRARVCTGYMESGVTLSPAQKSPIYLATTSHGGGARETSEAAPAETAPNPNISQNRIDVFKSSNVEPAHPGITEASHHARRHRI